MTLSEIVIIGLAAWRLSWMLVKEDGPANIFKRIRARTKLAGLLGCVHCLSVWWACVLYLIYPFQPGIVALIAAAGVASVIQHWLGLDFR